jgi:(1->4)-alpha-D-glucan 1-alpha-D-glucosylmutase
MNEHHGASEVDPSALYYLLQTWVASHPIEPERLFQHMLKACREAKVWTSWRRPNEEKERLLRGVIESLYGDAAFLAELTAFCRALEPAFVRHSVAQSTLKLTAPGVPNIYQGTELFDFSLADPDNRRPVDFEIRSELLSSLESGGFSSVRGQPQRYKLWCLRQLLSLRRERPDAFGPRSSYLPVAVTGKAADRVVAYCRGADVVVAVPRLSQGIRGDYADTRLELSFHEGSQPSDFEDVFTGETPSSWELDELWRDFPSAVLRRRTKAEQ